MLVEAGLATNAVSCILVKDAKVKNWFDLILHFGHRLTRPILDSGLTLVEILTYIELLETVMTLGW